MDDIEKLESDLSYTDEENVVPPSDIVAFNELRSCADLYRMYKAKQLEIQPDFQRNIVWDEQAQTRFIDSLIKQLPIPSLCIGYDYKIEKRIVIDGLQRIATIIRFLENEDWRLSELPDIEDKISDKTVAEIKQLKEKFFERVQNVTIPVTILRFDSSNQNHMDYLFTIFHRLNTGGVKLNNQEIRNCVYGGDFNDLLKKIADSSIWKQIFGQPSNINRFADEEIILRTFAFMEELDTYSGNLAKFLNLYMAKKQNAEEDEIAIYEDIMNATLFFINNKIQENKSIQTFGKTLKEGLLVGIAENICELRYMPNEVAVFMFNSFKNDPEFSEDSIKQGLSAKDKVQNRLKKSISIFKAW
jgi:hypothetical protein